jgi:hypothetical protein
MTTLVVRNSGHAGAERAGLELDLRMWLVTVPAVAVAVTTVPDLQVSAAHHWLNGVWRFLAMFGLATICSLIMTSLIRYTSRCGRRSDILLSFWWISAGAVVWLSAGWTAAIAGAAGAALLLHLIVRQVRIKLNS